MRTVIISIWLTILLSGITYLFWESEWKYSLPTPVPVNYAPAKNGDYIDLKSFPFSGSGKPMLIHFFNPECPCSRFNIPHFNSLVKKYSDNMNFGIVVIDNEKDYSQKEIQERFNVNVSVLFDSSIASRCGVYATPQAVIVDSESKLYYRGNYNKSRYCTNKNSNYAQLAIDSLLSNHVSPDFNHDALKAYGCSLPKCTN